MIGEEWKSEISEFKDEKTGRTIKKLTSQRNNYHLYFSENSFDLNRNEIIFLSDRASDQDKSVYEGCLFNVFRMDMGTGKATQLTDEKTSIGGITKTPDSSLVTYMTGNQVKLLDTRTGKISVLYEETGHYTLGSPSISPNLRYMAFCRNEKRVLPVGPNYTGFKEGWYAYKDGRITVAYLDGSGWFDVFKDTHWVGHFQFSPLDPTIGTFCHEGPWNLVTQRIWLLDFVAHEAYPCFRQEEQDSVGHEFWTRDGFVFFDDRGPGHDGTITSNRTQAVATSVAVNENSMVPFVGLADINGNVVRKVDMPYYCNHYHANPDNTMLVGDDVDDLVLIDISSGVAKLTTLCNHKTSWHDHPAHCHPTWSWDGKRILYASDFGGRVNLYLLDV